ncbi:efflux RND transporter periplasmic adaptor subunit [Actinoplanes aureus]|uniref:Efflux RND transporter periplasmic adaptor subunit n=1 Tax=Actinoplanes aureus TaxID=2792083 RepID=A0A931FX90_9ACTN|nr:efflux RND transporter periplasmic adaptor subunit [Actinoplanes aureus]MBG0562512.1 efflux RND transporter periplasmic adaptor subunit [Actinoplanes aureus]
MSKVMGQKRWIGAAIVVAGVLAGGIVLAVAHEDRTETAAVTTTTVDRGEVTVDVATTGTVEPATTRSLSFAVGGTVESVAAQAGNRIKAGQTLATLDDTGAAGDVSDAQSRLAEAQARLASATHAAVTTTRNATACAHDSATPAAAACATRGYPDTGSDQVLSAQQAVNRAAKAVEDARDALDGTVIKAPMAGTVVSVAARVGDQVPGGSTVVSLADTYTMQVRADFPEADAGALAAGQPATVTPAGSDEAFDAKVVRVDPVGTSDGTLVRYGVLLSFADSPDDLLLGQSAQVKVRTGEVTSAVRVPSTAVREVSGGSGTVLVRTGNRSERRAVAVGLRGDRYTEITDGLAEGEQIVRF